jgi:hypothetical protein
MKGIYRALLHLYPADYRAMFADEMARAFDRIAEEHPSAIHQEIVGLIAGAAAEWIAKWTTEPTTRGRSLPDLRMMRPVGVTRKMWFGKPPCS